MSQLEKEDAQEVISFLPQTLAQDLIESAQSEIGLCKKVTFTPEEDAAKLDFILSLAMSKLNTLKKLDLRKEMGIDGRREKVTVEREGGVLEDIELAEEGIGDFERYIKAEKLVETMIGSYSRMVRNCLVDRRKLSGQWFGDRSTQTKSMNGMRLKHTIKLSGEQLLGELGNKASVVPVGQNVEQSITMTQTRHEVKFERNYSPVTDPVQIYADEFADAE